jgi:hypothetical protein
MKLVLLIAPSLLACSSVVSPSGSGGEDATTDSTVTTGGTGGRGTSATGGAGATGGDGTTTGAGGFVITGSLGMNDVSILAPLPSTPGDVVLYRASDVASDGQAFVPKSRHDQVLAIPNSVSAFIDAYSDLQIVAVRVDLCDRVLPGPCPDTEDGRLRVVFQPITGGSVFDHGLHAFYSIPRANLGDVVIQFRELASLRGTQLTDPLTVNSDVLSNDAYRTKLRSILYEYAGGSRLFRLTGMGQVATAAALRWIFAGIEKENGQFVDIVIPGTSGSTSSEVLLLGNKSYQLTPEADSPTGFLTGISENDFAIASSAQKKAALEALVSADNPITHSANTVQCAACHLSTITVPARASAAGEDPLTIAGRYQSGFNLSVSGGQSATDDGIIRGFGYRLNSVAISQRVVNETAQVLKEIEIQFPVSQ